MTKDAVFQFCSNSACPHQTCNSGIITWVVSNDHRAELRGRIFMPLSIKILDEPNAVQTKDYRGSLVQTNDDYVKLAYHQKKRKSVAYGKYITAARTHDNETFLTLTLQRSFRIAHNPEPQSRRWMRRRTLLGGAQIWSGRDGAGSLAPSGLERRAVGVGRRWRTLWMFRARGSARGWCRSSRAEPSVWWGAYTRFTPLEPRLF